MGRIIPASGFFEKPPPIMVQNMAMERLIAKYESLLESQVKVLACLAWHSKDVAKSSKKFRSVPGGFTIPHAWQESLPMTVDLNINEDHTSGVIAVRLLEPEHRKTTVDDTGWTVPDTQKRMEDAELAG